MTSLLELADPFLGNGATVLPPAVGLAGAWYWPKAQTGNTHPGPSVPWGWVSVVPWSGAYPTGYGLNHPNSCGQPRRLHESPVASGFSHFQHSGIGAVGEYYNHLRVCPAAAESAPSEANRFRALRDESATPGRYDCRLADPEVEASLTATARAACHRYRFAAGSGRIHVLASVGGLVDQGSRAEAASLQRSGGDAVAGWIIVRGVKLYVHACCRAKGRQPTAALFHGDSRIASGGLDLPHCFGGPDFGWSWDVEGEAEVVIGFSCVSVARAHAHADAVRGFDACAEHARAAWAEQMGVMQIEGGDERSRAIFASMLFHALRKPVDLSGDAPSWLGEHAWLDMATLWDQTKTLMPLLQTCYPRVGADIARCLADGAEREGRWRNGIVMAAADDRFGEQASLLAHQILHGAFVRGLPGFDWHRVLRVMISGFERGPGRTFLDHGKFVSPTHLLDCAQAAWCVADIAAGLGEETIAARFREIAAQWRRAFGADGLMVPGWFYEGTTWNYSFRPFHAMRERIELCGGDEGFVGMLDRFFGYGQPPTKRPGLDFTHQEVEAGMALGRFEGVNNESDMETPVAYHFAGRPDRAMEVLRAGCASAYGLGSGGLAGNDDSGGLASWYLWSSAGLFPVSGTSIVCLASPLFSRLRMPCLDGELTIEAPGAEERAYVGAARLNGKRLDRSWLDWSELRRGGRLELEMVARPTAWGREQLPDPMRRQPKAARAR
jgi:putative alpha-1,2-mannosidase